MRPFDLFGAVVVAAWVVWFVGASASTNLDGEVEHIALTDAERSAGWRDGDEWQGIYLKEQKVGYIHLEKWREPGAYFVKTEMVMHLTVMRTRQKIRTRMRARLGPEMVLESFELEITSGSADMRMEGEVEGSSVALSITSGGGVQRQTVELEEPPRLSASLKPLLMKGDLKVGDSRSMSFFDPASMTQRSLKFTFKGRDTLLVMGQEVEAFHFTQTLGGISFELWTNGIGEVLREDLPMGLMGIRESGVEARYGVVSGAVSSNEDVVDAVSVLASGRSFSSDAPEAVFELSGLNFDGLDLEGGRQRWAPSADGTSGILTVEAKQTMGSTMGLTVAELDLPIDGVDEGLAAEIAAARAPELMIQSDNEALGRAALRAVKTTPRMLPEHKVMGLARNLSQWVYSNVKKESVVGVPSALETLDTMRGDCNEHTTFTVALLRSVGVAARPVVGIAFLQDRGRFFYHAWVEVWDGRWVAIDPTFGQFPADIGHIRFVVGGLREQVEMFKVIGQLKIEHR